MRERPVSVRCDREDVCKQREDICRHRSGNSQITEVGALFNRAVSVLRCECALTATETLRGEGMRACKQRGDICRDNVQGMHRE